ncbi:1-acyl-sn-glycerol-3-phosphate acyltransferase [Adhaeribacter radiodurans]|uniref:1-acyl-sn-glycerol-3-phosphate acyltransferase n=1 Tax=Adhaeribacter radiodurans TaxID=2745197 RepID=A0A7L7LD25_9BACT|nr:1-acyl-sn-glycerol-3-phosphate acyltransferase [Adhaeribacter radiodurans]
MPDKGPLLLVANHPNTFMDPIVIASLFKQEIYFIAKSTVFSSPFRKWLLQRMNLIPVYRREDGLVVAGANESTFEKCYEFLNAKGSLLIFPEGNSFNERRLRPLKTGAARIALGAAARLDFTQEVKILPIGLNYLEPTRFRSNLLINVAPPIVVNNLASVYQQDASKAVYQLTNQIRTELEANIIHTHSNTDDELVYQVETVFKNHLLTNSEKTDSEQEFQLTRAIVASLEYFKRHDSERVKNIQHKLKTYLQQIKALHLEETVFYSPEGKMHFGKWLFTSILFLLIGLPLYLFGLLTNYLPYIIPAKVANALTEEAEFIAPILLTTGIFTFPLFYGVELYLFWYFTQAGLLTLLFFLSLPLSGFFVLHYFRRVKNLQTHLRLQVLLFNDSKVVNTLLKQREEILIELELARQQYLQKMQQVP